MCGAERGLGMFIAVQPIGAVGATGCLAMSGYAIIVRHRGRPWAPHRWARSVGRLP
jgi:hypothetical protein